MWTYVTAGLLALATLVAYWALNEVFGRRAWERYRRQKLERRRLQNARESKVFDQFGK